MKKAVDIKKDLSVETKEYNFRTGTDKSEIVDINFTLEEELTNDTLDSITECLDKHLEDYKMHVNLERNTVRAVIE